MTARIHSWQPVWLASFTALLLCALSQAASAVDVVTGGHNLGADISPVHGRIAMALDGSIWVLAENGGRAMRFADDAYPLARPRWSPDGGSILYQSRSPDGSKLWVVGVGTRKQRQLSKPGHHDQDGSWHPDGERIVFASDRSDSGLDIWEMDLPTGLEWRLSSHPGDETEPVWSANGRHLAYILADGQRYALMMRRHGEPEEALVESAEPLSAPSWRPDGSLLTYFHHTENGPVLEMAILSEPPIIRVVEDGEALGNSAVSWRNRMKMVYTAGGQLRTRNFEARRSRPVHFRAIVTSAEEPPAPRTTVERRLEITDPGDTPLLVRGSRLFDGLGNRYRENVDVIVEDGRIAAIEERRARDDMTVLDLGNVTIIPGLIDAWSTAGESAASGPGILAYGVTTIVAEADSLNFDTSEWAGDALPGPRLLPAAKLTADGPAEPDEHYFVVHVPAGGTDAAAVRETVTLWRNAGIPILTDSASLAAGIDADFLLGVTDAPFPSRYALISALADAGTPGITRLMASRQAASLGQTMPPARRFGEIPPLGAVSASVVAGSKPNGLPAGQGLHAELLALAAAGLNGEQVLQAAGRNAARMLGLENQVGTILPGAVADLVLVAGDPLARPTDLLNIVAVVRNGRFFSLVSLLERARVAENVE
jgi:hypothetical protein